MLDESSDANKQYHSRHAMVKQNIVNDVGLDLGSDIFDRMPDFEKSGVELNQTDEDVNVTMTGNFLLKPREGISIDLTQQSGAFEIEKGGFLVQPDVNQLGEKTEETYRRKMSFRQSRFAK